MGAIAAGALTVSCGDDTDVQKQWESKVIDSEFNEFFTEVFGDIDSEQDFRMVTQRTMNITNVGGDVNTTYTIYVCQGNPNYEDDAMALYQTTAQGQSAVSFKFDAPTGLSHLWVVRSAPNDQVASYVTVYKTAKSINLSLEDDETRAQVSETTVNELTNNLFDFSQVHDSISGHTYTMSAPSTVLQDMYYDQSKASGFEFKAESGTFSKLDLYNYRQSQTTPCKIYVNGDVTIKSSCTFFFVEFYIPDGSTLTYNGANIQGVRFYVKEGGKLILNTDAINAQYESYPSEIVNEGEVIVNGANSTFQMSNYCNFYNAGTMTFNCPLRFNPADGNSSPNYFTNYSGATMTGQSVFIGGKGAQFANAGTMTLSSVLELSTGSGGGAQAINTGTMNLAGLSLNAGVTHFYNGGTTIVSGLTESTQRGNTWVNNGYYKTEKLNVDAYNGTFYNYCQLMVSDEFYLHEATFNNMSSSYVQASKMDMGNFTFNLWDNAVLYVTDLLSIPKGKGSGSDNGFHGLGNEYALVAAKQVDVLASSSKNIQFLDKVNYAWNSFRYLDENGNELTETQADALAADSYKHIFYADETAQSVSYSELSIKKPDSDKCGASEWSHGGGTQPQAYTYTLAYEDLGTKDDFDFNDIVLRVSHTGGTTEGTVQFVAAGGTLKISIAYDGATLFSHTDGVMYATGGTEGNYSISKMPGTKTATIVMDDDFSWTDDNCLSKFTLNVKNDGGDFVKAIPATTQAGYAPQCLVIPSGTWKWPTGRTSIKDAYPQFSAWVADKEANTTWYNYPASGKVYTGN